MISRASGWAHRSRLAGASIWAITCSESRRERRGGRRGVSPAKNTAVVGRVSSQPCWRIAEKNRCRPVTRVLLGAEPDRLGGQPGQIAFQQRPVDPGQRGDDGGGLAEERAEPGQRAHVVEHGAHGEPARQAQPGPALGQLAQPGLDDPVEP